MHCETDVVKTLAAQVRRAQQRLATRKVLLVIELFDVAPGHQRHQAFTGHLACRPAVHHRAVSQHRHGVREIEDLLHSVADVHEGGALGVQPPDQAFELFGLLGREEGRRLVENQQPGATQHRLGADHQLLLPDAQRRERTAGRDPKSQAVEEGLRLGVHLALIDQSPTRVFDAQKQVLGHTQAAAHHHLLMHCVNAQFLRLKRIFQFGWLPVQQNLAAVTAVYPGQNLDQGAFARAVLAHDGVDGALLDGQVDGFQGVRAGKPFFDLAQFQQHGAASFLLSKVFAPCQTRRGTVRTVRPTVPALDPTLPELRSPAPACSCRSCASRNRAGPESERC